MSCRHRTCCGSLLHGASRRLERRLRHRRSLPNSARFKKETNVAATMRDGTVLYADVYRPVESGSYPILLMRLPYDKSAAQSGVYGPPSGYAARCYIVVIQDLRGLYTSEGTFYPFRDELDDGYDTVEWAAGLPQSNGKVGMYGFSYVGATQWLAAIKAPPHLAAIAPAHTGSDYYDGWSYEGGAFSLAFEEDPGRPPSLTAGAVPRLGDQSVADKLAEARGAIAKSYTHLPIRTYPWLMPDRPEVAGFFFDWVKHSDRDEYWRRWSIRERWPQVRVPALVAGLVRRLPQWQRRKLRRNAKVRWFGCGSERAETGDPSLRAHSVGHQESGDVDFGSEAANTTMDQQLRFFDYWLKGKNNGADKDAPVRVFVMGANVWRDAQDWPIPGTRFTKFYLHSRGQARTHCSATGNSRPSLRSVGSRAIIICTIPPTRCRARADILAVSLPLRRSDRTIRPISSGALTCSCIRHRHSPRRSRLQDRSRSSCTPRRLRPTPTGRRSSSMSRRAGRLSTSITASCARAIATVSQRTSRSVREKSYEYSITVFPTSNLFKVGHQIRLEISSSNSLITIAISTPGNRSASMPRWSLPTKPPPRCDAPLPHRAADHARTDQDGVGAAMMPSHHKCWSASHFPRVSARGCSFPTKEWPLRLGGFINGKKDIVDLLDQRALYVRCA